MNLIRNTVLVLLLFTPLGVMSKDYYVHPELGNDQNDGSSKKLAIKTLARASQLLLVPGDRILLAAGKTFHGSLQLRKLHGESNRPITITSVRWNNKDPHAEAIIDSKGLTEGILVEDCNHIRISFIKITANGYTVKDNDSLMRTAVMIKASRTGVKGVSLDSLGIYDVFYENEGHKRGMDEVKTANGTERYGWGIRLINAMDELLIDQILIQNCSIENVSHTGIKLTGKGRNIQNIRLIKNKVMRTGGPGIQMSNVRLIYVAENEVSKSGSADDSRKWGRGSGLWTWSASSILIEKNKFMYANGPGDSAGAHIDYNCDNVILQYNFSAHNAGGFCEVLGNNYNCAYRYNISVNDGYRVKGVDGAFQEGKIFWLSGYQGNKERKGPVNTYFYNNTIFVNDKIASKIAIDNRSEGILIANNIFYLLGGSSIVKGDQYKPDDESDKPIDNVFFRNNLFISKSTWPTDALINDEAPLFGDPQFINGGGLSSADYTPLNKIIGRGVDIPFLLGDNLGLMQGLKMQEDILGKKIIGAPAIGAINY